MLERAPGRHHRLHRRRPLLRRDLRHRHRRRPHQPQRLPQLQEVRVELKLASY